MAVLLATSDIDELLALAHRILIVQRHSVTGTFERGVTRVEVVNALAETAA